LAGVIKIEKLYKRTSKVATNKEEKVTPLMRQYYAMKQRHPDAVLLFRVGDFYETYGDDAVRSSSILGITLTKRSNGAAADVEMAGFPHHAIDVYLPKLVRAGLRVAICEQLEDPKLAKGLVKRDITELVTPGVSYNDKVLENKENNFLCGLHLDKNIHGISFLDVSTGEFYLAQGDTNYIDKLLQSFKPSEIVLQKRKLNEFHETFSEKYYVNTFDDWVFTKDFANELLLKQFGTNSLKGFGVENLEMGIIAAGAALHYLYDTQHDKTQHICKITRIEEDKYVWIDKFSSRNLELIHSPNENAKTLIDVIDRTLSPMGSRQLKRWVMMPLKEIPFIEERLCVVDFMLANAEFLSSLQQLIKNIGDLERLIGKVAIRRITPRELVYLKNSLASIAEVKKLCSTADSEALRKYAEQINPCKYVYDRIRKEIRDDAPSMVAKGNVIADGVNEELDDLRKLSSLSKQYLAEMQQRESQITGIPSLKIGFNNVFGYYIEVTNAHRNKVPDTWTRKQTLTNAERYITPELKEYETKILTSEERIATIEAQLYDQILDSLVDFVQPIQYDAQLIARLDCLQSFASVSQSNDYHRPQLTDSHVIDIKGGRHPVIETQLPPGESYISNDVYLDNQSQQIIIITGPNMSGKSALLRQTALIVLLAQIGCYVPATQAEIGVVDKIFTRVGASDNLSLGESTFMVEMNETANILNNISDRSLVLLDEIGRGTSTYDGISIAWAITEYLHNHPHCRPKVLFATHYHELIDMEKQFERIRNYHISVKEVGNKVIFLRKLAIGGSEHSFGIHVAKMAGMPPKVVKRADEMLKILEEKSAKNDKKSDKKPKKEPDYGYQLSFIQLDDPSLLEIKDILLDIDIDVLTPVEALFKLNEIKKIVKKS
jgi:DNA mismatch repair protein MutS